MISIKVVFAYEAVEKMPKPQRNLVRLSLV